MPSTKHQQAGGGRSCAPFSLLLLFLISSLSPGPVQGAIRIPSNLKKPPEITAQPKSFTAFPVDDITVYCNASGNPPPSFRWVRNGKQFDPASDPGATVIDHSGSFIIVADDPAEKYQGKYRCYASNELGTAVSDEAVLIIEYNPTLPKDKKLKINVEEGDSVVLNCNPPFSSVPPHIHWMDKKLKHIELSERVTTSLDGSLYFANVIANDSRADYSCNAHYINARNILPMEPISLTVSPSNAVASNREPKLLSPSTGRSSLHTLRGKSLVLECIPEGLPTPTVHWVRKDGTLSASRTTKENHGRWLSFNGISESDDGEYECQAINSLGTAKHSFTVTVEAAPYWTKQPQSQLYAPGETVRLHCDANGIPTPNITWSMNGNPLSGIDQDPRRRVHGGILILKDIDFPDTAVYQCQASNNHGTILVNTYIHVIKLPPQILTEDKEVYKFTEGQTAVLKCNTFGVPQPKVTWVSSLSWDSVFSNPRTSLLTSGVLQINDVSMEDAGSYTCSVVNSTLSITAELQVFNRSVIFPLPESQRVRSGESATITCHAHIDSQLKIEQRQWRKARQKLIESKEDKYVFDGPSMTITNIDYSDEGKYSCEVMTSLDMANATVSIIVVDRPDAPKDLQVVQHPDHSLTLRWSPGDHHNSPITAFIVEAEEQRFGKEEWVEEKKVQGDVLQVELNLPSYSLYSFRVKAVNELGTSEATDPSEIFEIPATAPTGSPEKVKSESIDPGTLVITWQKMNRMSHNGPGFKYKVMWKKQDEKGAHWHHAEVEEPPFIVEKAGTYTPFMVKVQAVNKIGSGPAPPEVTLHSGEDTPLAAPSDVRVEHLDSPDGLMAPVLVKWAAVPPDTVRGKLLGYKIHLRWLGARGNGLGHMRRGKRQRREHESRTVEVLAPKEEVVLEDLRPYSRYNISIAAYNSKGEGPHSPQESFSTPEGKPGPPASLVFTSSNDTELTLHWTPPTQVNGVLEGYLLQYQEIVQSNDSPLQVMSIGHPGTSNITVTPLNPLRHYRFYLRARTVAGEGSAIIKDAATWLDGVPPTNISTFAGETYVNLSWVPGERHRNVEFHIQYLRSSGASERKTDTVNSHQSFHQIGQLKPGTHYNLSVIFGNKTYWSDDIKTDGPAVSEVQDGFATQGWFIGLISAIVLLLLVLLILCFIKRSKGGKYSVKDKEEGQVDSEARPMKDDTFGEYSDNEEKRTPSQPSLCVESKLGSDDSLAEYGDSVDIQFNEDGSFIGQYSGHRDGPGPGGPDSSGATSPVNPSAMGPPSLPNSITGLMGRGN